MFRMIYIIGNGFVGSCLAEQTDAKVIGRNDQDYNNSTLCYVCAPTGNRIRVGNDPEKDKQDVQNVVARLHRMKPAITVLIGTVDSLLNSENAYTTNRQQLEKSYKFDLIVRLPCLIHTNIQKNLLWDLSNQKWLQNHNISSKMQWYDLNWLHADINNLLQQGQTEYNLVSEPVENSDIVDAFFPELKSQLVNSEQKLVHYNICNPTGYHMTKQQIMNSIENYLKRK